MKMKKIVALVTASALCLGMSMTVMADYSIDDDNLVGTNGIDAVTNANPNGDYGVNMDNVVDGTLYEIQQKYVDEYRAKYPDTDLTDEQIVASFTTDQIKAIEDEVNAVLDVFRANGESNEERLDIFKKNGYVIPAGDVEAVVLATADLTATLNNGGAEMTDEEFKKRFPNGMTQQINVGDLVAKNDLGIGDTVYVLHYDVTTGVWETIPATVQSVGGDAWITVNFKSLSPIGIVKVMSNNKVIALDKAGKPITDDKGNIKVVNTNKNTTSKDVKVKAASTIGKSPKTGEF